MSREVRRVPKDWEHPVYAPGGKYIALHKDNYAISVNDWDESCKLWESGVFPDYASEDNKKLSFAEWYGERPNKNDYMPIFDDQNLFFMMYETTSEGTPISPAFRTPVELAVWLVANESRAFGRQTASYESWLRVAEGGYAPSAIMKNGELSSGVEGLTYDFIDVANN